MDLVEKYKSFSGYEERANKYGACAIELGKSVEVDWNYNQ